VRLNNHAARVAFHSGVPFCERERVRTVSLLSDRSRQTAGGMDYMKKAILIASALVAGFGASQVEAQALKGSDTLEAVTNTVLSQCPAAAGVTYLGTGSGNGENAMVAATQQISPMSRNCELSSRIASAAPMLLTVNAHPLCPSTCAPALRQ